MDRFPEKLELQQESNARALSGAYFLNITADLESHQDKTWYTVTDIDKDISDIVSLKHKIVESRDIIREIETDMQNGTHKLNQIVASADGIQKTADILSTSRHFSNVLFNVMRGGIFSDGYIVEKADFIQFLSDSNLSVLQHHRSFLR